MGEAAAVRSAVGDDGGSKAAASVTQHRHHKRFIRRMVLHGSASGKR